MSSVSATTVAVRGIREERHLPEHLARAERGELLARAIAVAAGPRAARPHGRSALLDDVEAVGQIALANDDLPRLEVPLLELAGQPGEVQPPQVEKSGERARAVARVGATEVRHESVQDGGYLR